MDRELIVLLAVKGWGMLELKATGARDAGLPNVFHWQDRLMRVQTAMQRSAPQSGLALSSQNMNTPATASCWLSAAEAPFRLLARYPPLDRSMRQAG
jgi:hypothetical protein